jgi:outer membrane lipoprotein carrier protein
MALSAGQDSAQDVLENVRKKYDTITDAEIRFTQKTKLPLGKVEQTSAGILYLKKDNKYRIETDDQTIITDGTTVWSFTPSTNQVLIDKYKQDGRTLTPEKLLTGSPEGFVPSLIGKERLGKIDVVQVKLVPTDDQSVIASIRIWVDDKEWIVRQVEVVDANGRQSTYTVQQVRLNNALQDSRFVFQIPHGADVVDMR